MLKKCIIGLIMAITAVAISFVAAPSANAEIQPAQTIVIDSAYSTVEDNLSFVLTISVPTCTETDVWEFTMDIENNSQYLLSTSITEGKGGTLEPNQVGGFHVEAVGPSKDIILLYSFGEHSGETYNFTVDAPVCDPHDGPDVIGLDCTLLNFTPPDVKNEDGSVPVGQVLNYEIVLAGPLPVGVTPYVGVSPTDRATGEVLHLENLAFSYTPQEAGDYIVEAFFLDENGATVPVEDPSKCSATLTVSAVTPTTSTPAPTAPAAPTVQPTKVATQLHVATLPETGSTTVALVFLGIGLIGLGAALRKMFQEGSK